jgi:hypothetical protein
MDMATEEQQGVMTEDKLVYLVIPDMSTEGCFILVSLGGTMTDQDVHRDGIQRQGFLVKFRIDVPGYIIPNTHKGQPPE